MELSVSDYSIPKQRQLSICLILFYKAERTELGFVYKVMQKKYGAYYARNKFHRDFELYRKSGRNGYFDRSTDNRGGWRLTIGGVHYFSGFMMPDWIPSAVEEVERESQARDHKTTASLTSSRDV